MTFMISDLSAGTNYTTSMSVQNLGGQSVQSSVTVVTQSHGKTFIVTMMMMMMMMMWQRPWRLLLLLLSELIGGGAYEARRLVPSQNLGPRGTLWRPEFLLSSAVIHPLWPKLLY